MRPEILNPLFTEVEALKGVGPQLAKLLKKLDLTRVIDLLYHLPTGAIERVQARAASSVLRGRNVILELKPFEYRESRSGRGPMRVFASDGEGNTISLIYFNNPGWAKRSLPIGQARTVSGNATAGGAAGGGGGRKSPKFRATKGRSPPRGGGGGEGAPRRCGGSRS